jgi:hypothetical protein
VKISKVSDSNVCVFLQIIIATIELPYSILYKGGGEEKKEYNDNSLVLRTILKVLLGSHILMLIF